MVPYWAAMTAAGAGVLGSVLAAVLRRGPGAGREPAGDPDEAEPTPDRPPLPKRDVQHESAIALAASGPRPEEPQPRPAADTGGFDVFKASARVEPQPMNPPPMAPPPLTPPPTAPPPVAPPPMAPPPWRRRSSGAGRIAAPSRTASSSTGSADWATRVNPVAQGRT